MKFCTIRSKGCDNVQNFMKTILSGLQTWTKKEIEIGVPKYIPDDVARISDTESDWLQNDSNATDYIQNRTHYHTIGPKVIDWHFDPPCTEIWDTDYDFAFEAGNRYLIVYNGKEYIADCGIDRYISNNESFPFVMNCTSDGNGLAARDENNPLRDFVCYKFIVKELDSIYLPKWKKVYEDTLSSNTDGMYVTTTEADICDELLVHVFAPKVSTEVPFSYIRCYGGYSTPPSSAFASTASGLNHYFYIRNLSNTYAFVSSSSQQPYVNGTKCGSVTEVVSREDYTAMTFFSIIPKSGTKIPANTRVTVYCR